MSELRQRMIEDMQLRGLARKTQAAYVRAVRQLAEYWGKSPEHISETELRQYFLYLKNEKRVSPSGFSIALCGIKFFYAHTLHREWALLDLARPTREKKLPLVLSREEVQQILGCLRRPRYQVCLSTIYGCGLRLQEGVHLQVQDIDSARMLVHIRQGKGGKDRYGAAPRRALAASPAILVYPPACGVAVSKSAPPLRPPDVREWRPAGLQGSVAREWGDQGGYRAYVTPLLRAPLVGSGD